VASPPIIITEMSGWVGFSIQRLDQTKNSQRMREKGKGILHGKTFGGNEGKNPAPFRATAASGLAGRT